MALNRMIAAGKNRQWRLLTWLRPVFATLMALILPGCQSPFEQALTAPRERPNILFILTDDQRFDAMHCAGNGLIQTPNIDRLATEGVRFQNHFVTTSICCVSRASILTAQYGRRHGIGDFKTPLTAQQWAGTYPALLCGGGYRI